MMSTVVSEAPRSERAQYVPPDMRPQPDRSLARDALRWWWLVVIVPLLAMAAAWLLTQREPRVYQATSTLAVIPALAITDESDVARALETLERRTLVATFSRIAETRETKAAAASRLGLPATTLGGYDLDAQVVPSTNILRIRVEGSDPGRAAALANAAAAITASDAARLYRLFALQMVEAAIAPTRPARPNLPRALSVAFVLGLAAGIALALIAAFVRRTRIRQG